MKFIIFYLCIFAILCIVTVLNIISDGNIFGIGIGLGSSVIESFGYYYILKILFEHIWKEAGEENEID